MCLFHKQYHNFLGEEGLRALLNMKEKKHLCNLLYFKKYYCQSCSKVFFGFAELSAVTLLTCVGDTHGKVWYLSCMM